jgi:hypothetical protein
LCCSFTTRGQCAWVDESDPLASPSDGGRGISKQAAHYDWAIVGENRLQVAVIIQNRLKVLKSCLTLDKYARLYADMSLIMADYGVQYAGWSPNAEKGNDGGKGTREWTGHYNYVNNGGGEDLIKLKIVEKRLNDLCRNLSIEDFANLYAELSVKMAFFGRRN